MSPAAPERVEELAALCAAGAASATERAELESLAAQDPRVNHLIRGYADAASLLALDLVPLMPPAGALDAVRQRLVPRAGAGGGVLPGAPGRRPGPGADVIPMASRRRGPAITAMVFLPVAAAAAFAFVWWQERGRGAELGATVARLSVQLDTERRVRTRAEEEAARLQREKDEIAVTLQKVQTPALRLATAGDPKGVVLKLLIDPLTGSFYVMAFQLPAADQDHDYQLWFVDKKKPTAPVPSLVFGPGPTAAGPLQVITRLPPGVDPVGAAISLEKKGGSTTGKPDKVLGGGAFL
ncbi:MAG TPA: anti-sigma factor [Candidatus Acidoferrum sp.]|nr:anti-sigma factor [Candidatus Acidoferrum sp.]